MYIYHDDLTNDKFSKLNKTKAKNNNKTQFPYSPLNQDLVTRPRSARALSSRIHVPGDMFPALAIAPFPPLAPRPSLLCELGANVTAK